MARAPVDVVAFSAEQVHMSVKLRTLPARPHFSHIVEKADFRLVWPLSLPLACSPATILFFGWFYASERHAVFARARRTLAMANLLAFIVFSLYPCMPPRLLPKEFGFVDAVLRSSVRSIYNHNKYQNQYAAVRDLSLAIGLPSRHC